MHLNWCRWLVAEVQPCLANSCYPAAANKHRPLLFHCPNKMHCYTGSWAKSSCHRLPSEANFWDLLNYWKKRYILVIKKYKRKRKGTLCRGRSNWGTRPKNTGGILACWVVMPWGRRLVVPWGFSYKLVKAQELCGASFSSNHQTYPHICWCSACWASLAWQVFAASNEKSLGESPKMLSETVRGSSHRISNIRSALPNLGNLQNSL